MFRNGLMNTPMPQAYGLQSMNYDPGSAIRPPSGDMGQGSNGANPWANMDDYSNPNSIVQKINQHVNSGGYTTNRGLMNPDGQNFYTF
jgi:hypothetical protein